MISLTKAKGLSYLSIWPDDPEGTEAKVVRIAEPMAYPWTKSTFEMPISLGETMQSRNNASCRCAQAGVIFSPPQLALSIRECGLEAIDTIGDYVMQQGSKEEHTVGLKGMPGPSETLSANPAVIFYKFKK